MIWQYLRWRFCALALIASTLSSLAPSSLALSSTALAAETDKQQIVFIAGSPSHGYGAHEHYAGCKVLAETLENANVGVETKVYRGWPEDAGALQSADTIVLYCDGGGGHLAIPHRDALGALMQEGRGLVCIHYAVEVPAGEVGDDFLNWLGGYFETNWSVNPHWEADFVNIPDTPVTRGVKPFKANDEWYFHMRFRPGMEGVTPILQAVPPESTMQRPDGPHSGNPTVRREVAERLPQTVAWTFERPDGGRSFGFTGGHFHWNWGRPEVLRTVTNAILWTAHAEVPEGGVSLDPPNIERLEKDQDFEPPQDFNPRQIAEEFHISKLPMRRPASAPAGNSDEPDTGRKLFASPVLTSQTPGHSVKIDVPLGNTRDLFLVVTDGGDGFTCDWADWLQPTLSGPKGDLPLTELEWVKAESQWGQVGKGLSAGGQPLSVDGKKAKNGIGTHANSTIHFRIPEGYDRFRAVAALDDGGTGQNNGGSTSIQFLVYADAAPAAADARGSDNPTREAENAVAGLDLPEDLRATLVASEPDLRSLTNLDIDDRGRIWVIDVVNYRGNNGRRPEGDRILILEDLDQDGVADQMKVFYQGRDIDSAMGICVLGNEVIVSAAPNIWKFIDEDGDDIPDQKIAMFTETGQPQHDHSDHSFLFGPDGKLYWNVGNTGQAVKDANGQVVVDIHGRPIVDNGKPFFGGMPFRCDLDGSHMEVLAHNFRNNWETTVDSFGTLWQSDNDDDGNRGVRINFVMEHGNYGYRDQTDGSSWQSARINMEQEIPLRHWHLNDPGVVPNLLQTGAGSPTGICVYEGRLLPQRYWDEVIHCDAGPNVVRAYPAEKSGAGYTATIEPIISGERDQWFRPADVCVAPDGSLFVTDWYDPGVGGHRQEDIERGRLFRIAPPDSPYTVPKFDYTTPEGASQALRNPNLAVRYKAWMALHAMGAQAEPVLTQLWQDSNPRIRARALWLLGKIPGRGVQTVEMALADENEDIRVTGIRLAKQLETPIVDAVRRVTDDSSPAVLREGAIALRFSDAPEMPRLWAALATRYDGQDRWYLEALGIGSDLRGDECFAAWLELVGDGWRKPAGQDIVWRTRADDAAAKMAQLIADPSRDLQATDRLFRSLEFHSTEVRGPALRGLLSKLVAQSDSADEALRVRNDALIVRSIERIPEMDWRQDEALRTAVERHIRRSADGGQFLELIKQFRPSGFEPQLLERATSVAGDSQAVEAARLLLESPQGRELVHKTLADPAQAAVLAGNLGLLGDQQAIEILTPVLNNPEQPYEVRAAAVRSLATSNLGSQALLDLTAEGRLLGDVRLLAGGMLARSQDAQVRDRAAELLPLPTRPDQAPLPPLDQLASMKGDAARGKELFGGKATCANCHLVAGQGKQVGPDLSEIGSKLSREAMLVSVLDPSAGISHNYENFICLLDSGQVVSGVMVSQTDEAVTLRTAEAIDRTIPREEIEELKKSDKSIMPDNLHHTFDTQGLIDVVEFMSTLKKAG